MSKSNIQRVVFHGMVLTALGLGLQGCKNDAETAAPAAETKTEAAKTAAPTSAVSAQVAAMSVEQLREAAAKAVTEQRLYAPAGDNAMEYYLALRDKAPTDPAVASALTDLQPYTLIATEQGIARDDFAEAKRLYGLLEKTDANAPALPRLKQSIADAEASLATRQVNAATAADDAAKRAEMEKQRLADQKKLQDTAAQELKARQTEEKRLADLRAAEAAANTQRQQQTQQQQQAEAARAAEAQRQREAAEAAQRQRQAQQPAAQPDAPRAAAAGSNELRAISTPGPRYPASALRTGQSGTVQVEFTVNTDGSVGNARVVNADPPRIFNAEALNAVKRWRFQPVSSPVTSRRTFSFNPGD